MVLEEVNSSIIRYVVWDIHKNELDINFCSNDTTYRYFGVDYDFWMAFLVAHDDGKASKFFHQRIRGHFEYELIDEDDEGIEGYHYDYEEDEDGNWVEP